MRHRSRTLVPEEAQTEAPRHWHVCALELSSLSTWSSSAELLHHQNLRNQYIFQQIYPFLNLWCNSGRCERDCWIKGSPTLERRSWNHSWNCIQLFATFQLSLDCGTRPRDRAWLDSEIGDKVATPISVHKRAHNRPFQNLGKFRTVNRCDSKDVPYLNIRS